jgi:Protein of unknown function (DUF3179)
MLVGIFGMFYLHYSVVFIFASFVLSVCTGAVAFDEIPVSTNSTSAQTIPPQVPDQTLTIPPPGTRPHATLLPNEAPPPGAENSFSTDFSKHTVPYSEILSGGPPKDGIPAIDAPKFVSVNEAEGWLQPVEPVILVQAGDEARAYPIQILIWHEIVNDTVGGLPLVVTFCPLCNTAIAFERRWGNKTFDFGTTGKLRYSNLIMYDRQTETWWQQATGEGIAGELAGEQLVFYPAAIISWSEFKSAYPDGPVLSLETGFARSYGENPYTGYDDVSRPPFLYRGPETPGDLPPVARVLTVDLNEEAVAYPYDLLQELQVINDIVGGHPVAVFWAAGTASALDAGSVASGRDVGSANAYSRLVNGKELHFTVENDQIVDQETNSGWNLLGQAVSGEMAGTQLEPVVAINHFWFSWAAFKPETRIYQP